MGIYSGDERIDSVNVGSKDMVVLMQDNHILALGKKYWAVDLGTLSYNYDSSFNYFTSDDLQNIIQPPSHSSLKVNAYCGMYKVMSYQDWNVNKPDMSLYCSTLGSLRVKNTNFSDTSEFKTAMSGVWLVFEFNQTLYAKVDLGSLNWEKYGTTTNTFSNTQMSGVIKKPANDGVIPNVYCFRYVARAWNNIGGYLSTDDGIGVNSGGALGVCDNNYTVASDFKQSVKGITILYEKA